MEGVGGRTLPELYQDWTRLVSKSRDGLETLERFEFSSPPFNGSVDPMELDGRIAEMRSLCFLCLRSFSDNSERGHWERKVEQVAQQADSLKESLDRYFLRNQ
ncbi:membrin-11-like [Actinidia eriantha]|uniref:membrin-11-like n=1 Tax=Actinidia eriantha TaxID=165200 RepID=UPI00258F2C5A|nr:membrin-11-like [Actinidia eriantha]